MKDRIKYGWAKTDSFLLDTLQAELDTSLAKGKGVSNFHLTKILYEVVRVVRELNEPEEGEGG